MSKIKPFIKSIILSLKMLKVEQLDSNEIKAYLLEYNIKEKNFHRIRPTVRRIEALVSNLLLLIFIFSCIIYLCLFNLKTVVSGVNLPIILFQLLINRDTIYHILYKNNKKECLSFTCLVLFSILYGVFTFIYFYKNAYIN